MKFLALSALIALPFIATAMELDQKGLEEFKSVKELIIAKGQKLDLDNTNKLINVYREFAEMSNEALASKLSQPPFQAKIKELHDAVSANPEYRQAFEEAKSENVEGAWKYFRFKNGDLLKNILIKKGIYHPQDPTQLDLYLMQNNNIERDAAEYVIAGSFLLYYTRQMQRQMTGKDLPPIVIK